MRMRQINNDKTAAYCTSLNEVIDTDGKPFSAPTSHAGHTKRYIKGETIYFESIKWSHGRVANTKHVHGTPLCNNTNT